MSRDLCRWTNRNNETMRYITLSVDDNQQWIVLELTKHKNKNVPGILRADADEITKWKQIFFDNHQWLFRIRSRQADEMENKDNRCNNAVYVAATEEKIRQKTGIAQIWQRKGRLAQRTTRLSSQEGVKLQCTPERSVGESRKLDLSHVSTCVSKFLQSSQRNKEESGTSEQKKECLLLVPLTPKENNPVAQTDRGATNLRMYWR